YIKQNAKVIAFNVDPLFNNAVDGLMYIRIADLPEIWPLEGFTTKIPLGIKLKQIRLKLWCQMYQIELLSKTY
ncbi:hypothetical protein MWU76_21600, partial [Gelidibacter sp. F2691]|nr:hypothetical protein [Gelidibacter sp. F2691]